MYGSVGLPREGIGVTRCDGPEVGAFVRGRGVCLDGVKDGLFDGARIGVCLGLGLVTRLVGFRVGGRDGFLVGLWDVLTVGFALGITIFFVLIMNALNLFRSRDPRPEAGSHPGAASNPCVQHVSEAVQLFLPSTTSFTNNL